MQRAYSVVAMRFGLIAFRDRFEFAHWFSDIGLLTVAWKPWWPRSPWPWMPLVSILRGMLSPGGPGGSGRRSVARTGTVCRGDSSFPCLFEFVYLSRPDSIMEQLSIYKARLKMGDFLAEKSTNWPGHDIDVVIPVPDTSRTAAIQVAFHLGVNSGGIHQEPLHWANVYYARAGKTKEVGVRNSAIGLEFKGKNVLLVDDSIVQGTTSEQHIWPEKPGQRKSISPLLRLPFGIRMSTGLICRQP